MYIKTFIASLIVAFVLSIVAFLVNLNVVFPPVVAYFAVALIAGIITALWVTATPASTPKSTRTAKRGKSHRPASKPAAASGPKETGSVKWFSPSKGFGFITRDNGDDIFVHFRSIMGKGHRVLREGQRVEFAVTEGTKGLQAEEVNKIN